MENIQFDSGVVRYQLNGGGVLQFNPGDPNVYARFSQAMEKIEAVEQWLTQQAKAEEQELALVCLMAEADGKIKKILDWVFGQGNDFDKALGGVNLLAVAGNGNRVVENLLSALEPVLVAGAEACVSQKAREAVQKAEARRANQ